MPPPSQVALLSWTRRRSNCTRMPLFSMPPPSAPALFSLMTESRIFTGPKLSMLMPPPSSVAMLFAKVEASISTGPPSV